MKFSFAAFPVLALAGMLTACGGGGGNDGGGASSQSGSVGIFLTDAPACGFDAVNVSVAKVRIHASASASDTDSGWTDINVSPVKKINLLNLNNGTLEALGTASLGVGRYNQLRLVLDSGANANTVIKSGTTTEVALDTPSALQSGIKLTNQFDVSAGQRVDLVLDFDACKSVLSKGGSGGYLLRPVVKVVPTALNGISGFVASAALASQVAISAQQNGVIVASTTPNPSTGEFALARLPAGSYDVVVTANGYAAQVVGGVPVTASGMTALSTAAAPIAPVFSQHHKISGRVSLSPASGTEPAQASAVQSILGGPVITVQYGLTPLGGGEYSLNGLPAAAPRYAAYSTSLPLVFTTATTALAPGQYRVDASATGYTTKSLAAIDVSLLDQFNIDFVLTP